MVSRHLARPAPATSLASGTLLSAPRPLTEFSLTDHLGQTFGRAQLAGRPSLVFFGFTHCPDVCPTTLALMAQLARDPALHPLRMLFITVDPERDDQQSLRQYVDAFGGGITALRGDESALEPLLRSLGAIRAVEKRVGSDYTVDHSATLHFINSKGELAAVFTPPFDYNNLHGDLLMLIARAN